MARKGRLVFCEMLIGPVSAMEVDVDIQDSKIAQWSSNLKYEEFYHRTCFVWVLSVPINLLAAKAYLTNVALDFVSFLISHGVVKAAKSNSEWIKYKAHYEISIEALHGLLRKALWAKRVNTRVKVAWHQPLLHDFSRLFLFSAWYVYLLLAGANLSTSSES